MYIINDTENVRGRLEGDTFYARELKKRLMYNCCSSFHVCYVKASGQLAENFRNFSAYPFGFQSKGGVK